jgi:hypothetical protein
MPNLAHLVANRMAATVDLSRMGAESMRIEYHLGRVTTAMLIDAATLDTMGTASPEVVQTALQALPDTLLSLLASWDLTETAEDGSERALPITRASLEALGFVLQVAIWRTILSAQGEAIPPTVAAAPSVTAPTSAAN